MNTYQFNGQSFELGYPAVMGILNLTPDSFSDGGAFVDPEDALRRALAMIDEGAQIIDLGGESTRPGSDPVSEKEELARILPVLEKLPVDQCVLSIDTTKPAVAQMLGFQDCLLPPTCLNSPRQATVEGIYSSKHADTSLLNKHQTIQQASDY